ncbi:hypothetical protein M3670_09125 [Cytobacillus kochii]|uniref:hypothetical protein n=1 Tax=Cytobacillus kochii TaxID=859143 RepID=UPI00203AA725|nr:hypothetical protein [Cytobacillus kochii]MCM3322343.1 hypothetical protein [Cytobacillus kochii]
MSAFPYKNILQTVVSLIQSKYIFLNERLKLRLCVKHGFTQEEDGLGFVLRANLSFAQHTFGFDFVLRANLSFAQHTFGFSYVLRANLSFAQHTFGFALCTACKS